MRTTPLMSRAEIQLVFQMLYRQQKGNHNEVGTCKPYLHAQRDDEKM